MVRRRNPLRRRYRRELFGDPGKYLVIFLLMAATIGLVSGCLVAMNSMSAAYDESFEAYRIEDGKFTAERKLSASQWSKIEDAGVTLFENFYADRELSNGTTMRFYKNRTDVDLVCLMDGAFPTEKGEVAIDRMYADNNGIRVGDTIRLAAEDDGRETSREDGTAVFDDLKKSDTKGSETQSWTVTGLVALSDYSALFSDNNDIMFDALEFGVGIVAEDAFDFPSGSLHYSYSWLYDTPPADDAQADTMSEEFLKTLASRVTLEEYIPRYQNQAIIFTGDDIVGDRSMMIILLYIIIVIIAFVFAVTISNTITKEANVIGTLRAFGFTKRELIRHYMTLPVIVTLISALIGNILGYTILKDYAANLYYQSYSLPTYVTLWNWDAFLYTTLVPILIMLAVNLFILHRKLRLPILSFLRHDLRRGKSRRAFPLPARIRIFSRFRLRVVFQNAGNYLVLLLGILFANVLLFFGLFLPSILSHYQEEMGRQMFCDYQYILKLPSETLDEDQKFMSMLYMMYYLSEMETDNADAEKFTAYTLETPEDGKYMQESVMLYGIAPDSRYLDLSLEEGDVVISSAYAKKYGLAPGDTVTLGEAYEDDTYDFTITDVYDYETSICMFLPQDDVNALFDLGDGTFTGYFSDSEITDIDEAYIATVIDYRSMTKLSRQLDHSMGGMAGLVQGFSILMFMVLVYLLSKTIIEKNAQPISMTKILGYRTGEIGQLYILPTSVLVMVFVLLSFPLVERTVYILFMSIMYQMMTGWIIYYVDPMIWVKMFFFAAATYAAVSLLEFRKIRRVPMDEALKNVE